MSSLQSSLDEEGKIYLEVPSGDWVFKHASLTDIHYPHLNYYSAQVIERIFQKAWIKPITKRDLLNGRDIGFVLVKTKSEAKPSLEKQSFTDFSSSLKKIHLNAKIRIAELSSNKKFAVYGANAGSQAMFGFFPQIKPEFMIDDTPSYEGACSYSSEARFEVVKPTAEILRSVEAVLIAAYIHDKVISEKIRATGFVGDIFSLRPPSDDSGTVRSLFAA
jgi:hypothetical protein